jgi:prepilin-type processing-associated H-X9-DG protein/prepilin-type N-terminal cleavage/methylation domain-containing protein
MLRRRSLRLAAFTLIEVMMVMAIMTSEANNYGDVKRLAYQTSCRNNLEQIWQALVMYDMNGGGLPKAVFYPKNPKTDANSLENVLDQAYRPMLVCPVFPSALKDTGLTYIYNDKFAGKPIDSIPDPNKTWIVTEMNAVSDKIPMPHPGGFNILYADGHIAATKTIPQEFIDLQKKAAEGKGPAPAPAPAPKPAPKPGTGR